MGENGISWSMKLFNVIFNEKGYQTSGKRALKFLFTRIKYFKVLKIIERIKLMGDTMKLSKRVIEQRSRRETKMFENQLSFMPSRSQWKLYNC